MKQFLSLLFMLILAIGIKGQKVALKTNLLYDLTTTLNIGIEVAINDKLSVDIGGNYNPWKFSEHRLKHWLVQPELRYWFCEKFNGHFLGFHGHYASYNIGGLFFNHHIKHYRYQGHLYGGGISYGYEWILNDRWNIEAVLGIGYAFIMNNKYPCADCGKKIATNEKAYWGVTKVGVSFIYIIH